MEAGFFSLTFILAMYAAPEVPEPERVALGKLAWAISQQDNA